MIGLDFCGFVYGEEYYIAQDVESEPAKISAEGIRGKWFVLEFEVEECPGGLTVLQLPTTEHGATPRRQDETAEQPKEIADMLDLSGMVRFWKQLHWPLEIQPPSSMAGHRRAGW